jgi:DNA-binding cell septation regulator SpoVG
MFTDLKIFKLSDTSSGVLANVSVTVQNTVKLSLDLRNGKNGPFLAVPSRKSSKIGENGKEIYYPQISFVDRQHMTDLLELVNAQMAAPPQGRPSQPAKRPTRTNASSDDGLPF